MAPRQPTLKDRIRDIADRFGDWLDEVFPTQPPVLVPVPVRDRPRQPVPPRRR